MEILASNSHHKDITLVDKIQEKAEETLGREEHENKAKVLIAEIVEAEQARDFLTNQFDKIEPIYRQKNINLVDTINRTKILIEKTKDSIAKLSGTHEELPLKDSDDKEKKPKKKVLLEKYRRICSLCHPDKTAHEGYSKSTLNFLSSMFIAAKKAYLDKELHTLDNILTEVMNVRALYKDDIEVKPKRIDKSVSEEELDALRASLISITCQLRFLHQSIMYKVTENHLNGNFVEANENYRAALMRKKAIVLAELDAIMEQEKQIN